MKVAVIGNSHIGALKLAIRNGRFKPEGMEVTFWGLPAHCFNSITFADGHFKTPYREFVLKISDDQYDSLPAHDFDAIIFHGPPLNLGHYLSSLRRKNDDIRSYSRACLREGLQTWIEGRPTFGLVRSLRAVYDRRLLMSPAPLISEDSGRYAGQSIRGEEFELLNRCVLEILSDIRAEYVPQPADTVRDYQYTKREFCVDSVRMFYSPVKHPDDDYLHMNELYGARVLHEIAAQLLGDDRSDSETRIARFEETASP